MRNQAKIMVDWSRNEYPDGSSGDAVRCLSATRIPHAGPECTLTAKWPAALGFRRADLFRLCILNSLVRVHNPSRAQRSASQRPKDLGKWDCKNKRESLGISFINARNRRGDEGEGEVSLP